jgi:hypothetical protein
MKNQNLGRTATDKITQFSGVIVGHAEYLTGCDQYLVKPDCDDTKKYPEAQWFDEGRLSFGEVKISQQEVTSDEKGCDYNAPKK